ncbi:MAG: hypothetical protein IJ899_14780 [Blautia sp.]|nr:hypothetical protein [Blautia sp.]
MNLTEIIQAIEDYLNASLGVNGEITRRAEEAVKELKANSSENPNSSDLIEWSGFDVYDAETEESLDPVTVADREHPMQSYALVDGFCLDWSGGLNLTYSNGDMRYIPRRGRYTVKFSGGKFMRW